jgi:hypothetical protein
MIVCTACGSRQETDDAFCASCGAFLEWAGERVGDPVTAEARSSGAAPPVARRRQPGQAGPAPPTRPRPTVTAPPEPGPIRPGDVVCPECHEGNDPERRFCGHCGALLVEEPPPVVEVVPIPWWKRPFMRKPKTAAAGERPMRRGGSDGGRRDYKALARRVIRWTALASVAILVAGYAGPWRRPINDKVISGYQAARRTLHPTLNPVIPDRAEASSALPDRPAMAAIDQLTNTHWSEAAPDEGFGQFLTVIFPEPTDVDKIGVYSGAQDKPESFLAQPRPMSLEFTFLPGGVPRSILLESVTDFQSFDVEARDVTSVKIKIVTVYHALNDSGKDCSITEIQFFRKT